MTSKKLVSLIQSVLSPDLLKREQRDKLTGIHPTEGHCAVAAEAAFHLVGGKRDGWVPVVLPRAVLGDNTHWWIENRISGERIDPTAEQFGTDPIPYHLGKPCGFMSRPGMPSKRAAEVIRRVREKQNGSR